eukprot:2115591-Amphidinium_carterae.1
MGAEEQPLQVLRTDIMHCWSRQQKESKDKAVRHTLTSCCLRQVLVPIHDMFNHSSEIKEEEDAVGVRLPPIPL